MLVATLTGINDIAAAKPFISLLYIKTYAIADIDACMLQSFMKLKIDPGKGVQLFEMFNIMITLFQKYDEVVQFDQPTLKSGSYT